MFRASFFRRKIAVALCGFYFFQWDRKSGAEFCAPTPLCYYFYFCMLLILCLHRLVGLRLLRLCLKLRQGFAPYPQGVSPLDPDQGRVPGPFARSARFYSPIAALTAFFQPLTRSLRLLSFIDGINSLNLSEMPTNSSALLQSPQPSPARYAAPVAVDSTL